MDPVDHKSRSKFGFTKDFVSSRNLNRNLFCWKLGKYLISIWKVQLFPLTGNKIVDTPLHNKNHNILQLQIAFSHSRISNMIVYA